MTWLSLKNERAEFQAELAVVRAERQGIEQRVRLLKAESLDPDLLDERVRVVLSLAHADEVIFLNK